MPKMLAADGGHLEQTVFDLNHFEGGTARRVSA